MTAPSTKLRASSHESDRDMVADLQRIGFSEYEARTYLSLLRVHPATAYEVSKHSGLPRANTYGALDALTKKRAVQPVTESPVRYAPVKPDVLLDRLSSDLNGVYGRLKEQLGTLEDDERSDIVWSLSGQAQIDEKINALIDEARGHIWIKASTLVLRQHTESLRRAARRGIALVFVVFGQDIEFLKLGRRCKVYLHEGNGVRIGGADNLFTVAIDYRVALTANLTDELTGTYTTNPSVVRMAETLIRHDFYMAEIMMAFPEVIEQRFGANLVRLRKQMFTSEQLRLLRHNLLSMTALRARSSTAPGVRDAERGGSARAAGNAGSGSAGAPRRRISVPPR